MNMKHFTVFGLFGMIVLLISACAPQQVNSSANPSGPVVEATSPVDASSSTTMEQSTAAPAAEATSTVDMEALIKEKVAGHHDLDRIYNAHKTRAEWEATLDRMIQYGAQINDQEKEMIIDYLLSRQGN